MTEKQKPTLKDVFEQVRDLANGTTANFDETIKSMFSLSDERSEADRIIMLMMLLSLSKDDTSGMVPDDVREQVTPFLAQFGAIMLILRIGELVISGEIQ